MNTTPQESETPRTDAGRDEYGACVDVSEALERELAQLRANLERLAARWSGQAEDGAGPRAIINVYNVLGKLRRVLAGQTPPEPGQPWPACEHVHEWTDEPGVVRCRKCGEVSRAGPQHDVAAAYQKSMVDVDLGPAPPGFGELVQSKFPAGSNPGTIDVPPLKTLLIMCPHRMSLAGHPRFNRTYFHCSQCGTEGYPEASQAGGEGPYKNDVAPAAVDPAALDVHAGGPRPAVGWMGEHGTSGGGEPSES